MKYGSSSGTRSAAGAGQFWSSLSLRAANETGVASFLFFKIRRLTMWTFEAFVLRLEVKQAATFRVFCTQIINIPDVPHVVKQTGRHSVLLIKSLDNLMISGMSAFSPLQVLDNWMNQNLLSSVISGCSGMLPELFGFGPCVDQWNAGIHKKNRITDTFRIRA